MRLQKFLAGAGVASRRHAEELILAGRVLVNNEVADTLPAFVDPQRDEVRVNGVVVRPQAQQYWAVHKPKGVVTTLRDPQGRPRIVDLLPALDARLYPVGRLDVDSTGLVLMSNDGELARRITHPSYGLPKVYEVEVRGEAPADLPQQLRKGVWLSEGKARVLDAHVLHRSRQRSALEITLSEGRNRQIRRMLAQLGYKVKSLKRTRIGPLALGKLPPGAVRALTAREVQALRAAVEAAEGAPQEGPRRRRARPKAAAAARGGAGRKREQSPERRKRRIVS